MANNLENLEGLLVDTLTCSKDDLGDESGPDKLVNWDSITHMEMVSKLEEKFDIELDVDEINQMDTVGAIKEVLRKHKITL